MNEEWKDVPNYEGLYKVSNSGKILGLKRNRLMQIHHDKSGYCRVHLSKNRKGKLFSVHRIVASVFVENSQEKQEVNHIDENKDNNNYYNLEWSTRKENINHGTRTKRMIDSLNKSVLCSNGIEYESIKVAAQKLNLHSSGIVSVLKGRTNKCGGYTFTYKEVI